MGDRDACTSRSRAPGVWRGGLLGVCVCDAFEAGCQWWVVDGGWWAWMTQMRRRQASTAQHCRTARAVQIQSESEGNGARQTRGPWRKLKGGGAQEGRSGRRREKRRLRVCAWNTARVARNGGPASTEDKGWQRG